MGEPPCLMSRICLACHRYLEQEAAEGLRCPDCGAELPPP